ncbi:unnamed protein product, partial [Closterium sp. NIES-54]
IVGVAAAAAAAAAATVVAAAMAVADWFAMSFSSRGSAAWTGTPRPPTPSVPITKLLNKRVLTGAQLLVTLATTKASMLRGCTTTSVTSSATSTTAAAASTAFATASTASTATATPTPGTTPTTTSTSSTASSTAPSTTLASLALASAASPTRGRRSADLLSAIEVDSSSRGNRGEKGDRETPLKKGGALVAARSPNS